MQTTTIPNQRTLPLLICFLHFRNCILRTVGYVVTSLLFEKKPYACQLMESISHMLFYLIKQS